MATHPADRLAGNPRNPQPPHNLRQTFFGGCWYGALGDLFKDRSTERYVAQQQTEE